MLASFEPRSTAALLLALLALGCPSGDDGGVESGTTGTSTAGSMSGTNASASSGATTAMTEATEPSTGSDGGSAGATGSGETAAPGCPADEPPDGPEVTFTIRNDRNEAIFVTLPYFCAEAFVRIDSEDAQSRWPIDACAPTCASIIADACDCPRECDQPTLLRIEPGATFDVVWNGAMWIDHLLEAPCNACEVAPDCLLGVPAADATYLATAAAASSASDCENGCECPMGQDTCLLDGTVADPQELGAQALFDYPADTTLELVFEAM